MFRHSDVSYTTVNSSTHRSRITDRTSTWMLLPDRGYMCDEKRKNNTRTDTNECPHRKEMQKENGWWNSPGRSRLRCSTGCRPRPTGGSSDSENCKINKNRRTAASSISISHNYENLASEIWDNIKDWTSFWSNQAERVESAARKVTSCLLSSEIVMLKPKREETQLLTQSWKCEWDFPSLRPSISCGKVGCHIGWRSDTRKLNYSINTLKCTTHLSCEFGAVNNRQQASLWFHFSPTESLTILSESKLLLKVSEMTSASSSELFEVGASNGRSAREGNRSFNRSKHSSKPSVSNKGKLELQTASSLWVYTAT